MNKRLCAALIIILIIGLCFSTAFAENGDDEIPETAATEQPEETVPLPEEPAPEPPQEEQTPQPEQTPEPPQITPTPEDYGTVDLVIYTYTSDGQPGKGYSVKIDETIQKANDEGRVVFTNLTVERHNLSITNNDGTTRTVTLYMSRANSTRTTGVAEDGTCGLDIARGVSQAYMTVDFIPDEPLSIKLSENKPTPPSVAPSESASASSSKTSGVTASGSDSDNQYEAKEVFATFNDSEGKSISKLKISVRTDSGQNLLETTNNSGRIELNNIPYGTSEWSFDDEYNGFKLEMRKGVQTGVITGEGDELTVSVPARVQGVYLTFVKTGDGFVLEEASESSGDMSAVLLVLIIIVIAVGVIITVLVVKKIAGRKPQHVYPQSGSYIETQRPERTTPRSTGGSNKLTENISDSKKRDSNFDDRYRM